MLYVWVYRSCFVEYRACATPGGWVTPKKLSSYSFDRIVLVFGYIVERINTKILSSHFWQFQSWTQIMTSSMTSFPVLQKLS